MASDVLSEALRKPPESAIAIARVLQVIQRHPPVSPFQEQVDMTLAPLGDELRLRLRQIDQIANPETEPQAIVEVLGDEAESLDLAGFDADLLRSKRSGAGGKASRAAAFLEALGWEKLPEGTQQGLRRALGDLKERERFQSQALLIGPAGEGFVVGLKLQPRQDGEVSSDERLDEALRTQAAQALHKAFDDSVGAILGLEWQLPVEGTSIGLAVVVAALVARRELEADPLMAATGQVDLDGAVRGVEGIQDKLAAASAAGVQRVLLSDENRPEAESWLAATATELELLFVSDVAMAKPRLARMPAGTQLGADARKRLVHGGSKEFRFDIEDERPIPHGFQFKLSSLDGKASISLYDSGKVVVGGAGASKERAEALVAKLLPALESEPRPTLTLRVTNQERLARVEKGLVAHDAERLDPKEHERWRFRVRRGPSAATVVQYASGKLLLQGSAPAWDEVRDVLKAELGDLGGAEGLDAVPDLIRVRERRENSDEPWIGTDESGKGDFFGPLVSAAVFTDERQAAELKELGVADSKKLSDRRVFALAPQLREMLGKAQYVTVIGPERFNSLYSEMRAEGKRLNAMLAWGHTRSIESLLQRGLKPGYAIVDQFADVRFIDSALLSETRRSKLEILQFPKAEMDMAVAAASILAREAFLSWLAKASTQLGFELPKGAGPKVIEAGRDLVARRGADELDSYAKLSFKTREKVLAR